MMLDTEVIGKVTSHVLTTSKNGTPSILFVLEADVNGEQKRIHHNLWLTEKGFEHTMRTLEDVFGWRGNDLEDFNGTEKFKDSSVKLVIYEDEYNGKVSIKVRFMNAIAGSGGAKKLPPEDAKSISKSLQGRILQYRKSNQSGNLSREDEPLPWEK